MWLKIKVSKDRTIIEHNVKEFSVREGTEGTYYIEYLKNHDGGKGQMMVRDYSVLKFGKETFEMS